VAKRRDVVRLIDSVSDCQFTSRKRALKFVKDNRADWVDDTHTALRFRKEHHTQVSSRISTTMRDLGYDRASGSGVARIGRLANTPVVAPGVLLGFGRNTGAHSSIFKAIRGLV
jgi:hypothetical protein